MQETRSSLTDRFRGNVRVRAPLHPLEKAVLTLTCLHLGFLPWALGTMHAWSQLTSLGLAGLTFVVALLPRTYSGELARGLAAAEPPSGKGQEPSGQSSGSPPLALGPLRYAPVRRLARFPLFWLGGALLLYICLQASNPSWVWERNETHWWLTRVNDIPWLPTSIDAPWERFNLWRQFVIYASAWLTVCALWIGLTRRRSIEILLTYLVLNACLLAGAGILQKLTGSQWLIKSMGRVPTYHSFGPFIYHNHAGAYLALLASTAAALAMWKAHTSERSGRRSTPAPLFALAAFFIGGTVLFTWSRGAVLSLALFAVLFALWFGLRRWRLPSARGNSAVALAVAAVFAVVVGFSASLLDFTAIVSKFNRLAEQQTAEESTKQRLLANQASLDYLDDHGIRGIGAGSFRHLYPEYVKSYPEIYRKLFGRREVLYFWEHAHNDWLQIPIELGAVGSLLLLSGMSYWLFGVLRRRSPTLTTTHSPLSTSSPPPPAWCHPLALPLLLGGTQTLMHAWMDFPFQNPAILCTWLALGIVALKSAEIDAA